MIKELTNYKSSLEKKWITQVAMSLLKKIEFKVQNLPKKETLVQDGFISESFQHLGKK